MITIKGYEKWIDFVYSIKGNLVKCVEASELDNWYFFRWEGISNWNYPMYEVSLRRIPHGEGIDGKGIYYLQSQCIKAPMRNEGESYVLLNDSELRDKDIVEKKILEVLINSCG
jgi:hypothetical protein